MSAFVVSHDHINTLLTFANKHARDYGRIYPNRENSQQVLNLSNVDDLQKIAEILYAQNVRSVHCRYPGDETVFTLPGVVGEVGTDIHFRFARKNITAVAQLKLLSCYDYQSCETDDYPESLAARIVEALRKQAISALPGYADAEWEV